MAQDYVESWCEGVDAIIRARLSNLNFNSTIQAVITDASKRSKGEYQVSYNGAKFTAYSTDKELVLNDTVNVMIPNNDFSQQKIILGKQVSTLGEDFSGWTNPFSKLVNLESKTISINKLYSVNNTINNTNEKNVIFKSVIQKKPNNENLNLPLKDYKAFGIRANFQTFFPYDFYISGEYGLICELKLSDKSIIEVKLSSASDFLGNPYSLNIPSIQEAVFDDLTKNIINYSNLSIVDYQILFYEDRKFRQTTNEQIQLIENAIKISDITIIFGNSVDSYDQDTLVITTDQPLTYTVQKGRQITATLSAQWVHVDKDLKPPVNILSADNISNFKQHEEYKIYWYQQKNNSSFTEENNTYHETDNLLCLNKETEHDQYPTSLYSNSHNHLTQKITLLKSEDSATFIAKIYKVALVQKEENNTTTEVQEEQLICCSDKITFVNEVNQSTQQQLKLAAQSNSAQIVCGDINDKNIIDTYNGQFFVYQKDGCIKNGSISNKEYYLYPTIYQYNTKQISEEQDIKQQDLIIWSFHLNSMYDPIFKSKHKNNSNVISASVSTLIKDCIINFGNSTNHAREKYIQNNILKVQEELKLYKNTDFNSPNILLYAPATRYVYILMNIKQFLADERDEDDNSSDTNIRLPYKINSVLRNGVDNKISLKVISKESGTYPTLDSENTIIIGNVYNDARDLLFGQLGTSGSAYKILFEFENQENCITINTNNKSLSNNKFKINVIDENGNYITNGTKTYQLLHNDTPQSFPFIIGSISDSYYTNEIKYNSGQGYPGNHLITSLIQHPCLLQCTITGLCTYDLIETIPLAFTTSDYSCISGPKEIMYETNGTLAAIGDKGYELFDADGDYVSVSKTDWEIKCQAGDKYAPILEVSPNDDAYYYIRIIILNADKFAKKKNQGELYIYNGTRYTLVDNNAAWDPTALYYRKHVINNYLVPLPMYVETNYYYAVLAKVNNKVVFCQTLYIYKDYYPSGKINAWNGKLTVNGDDNYILAASIGAGKKNADNTFTGVLMGDWSKDGTNALRQTGLYGFNKGTNTFALTEDGNAYFAGAGSIAGWTIGKNAITSPNRLTTIYSQEDKKYESNTIGYIVEYAEDVAPSIQTDRLKITVEQTDYYTPILQPEQYIKVDTTKLFHDLQTSASIFEEDEENDEKRQINYYTVQQGISYINDEYYDNRQNQVLFYYKLQQPINNREEYTLVVYQDAQNSSNQHYATLNDIYFGRDGPNGSWVWYWVPSSADEASTILEISQDTDNSIYVPNEIYVKQCAITGDQKQKKYNPQATLGLLYGSDGVNHTYNIGLKTTTPGTSLLLESAQKHIRISANKRIYLDAGHNFNSTNTSSDSRIVLYEHSLLLSSPTMTINSSGNTNYLDIYSGTGMNIIAGRGNDAVAGNLQIKNLQGNIDFKITHNNKRIRFYINSDTPGSGPGKACIRVCFYSQDGQTLYYDWNIGPYQLKALAQLATDYINTHKSEFTSLTNLK